MATTPSRRVLVVDDNDALRDTVCESVRRLGYDVLAAGDCETALRLLDDPLAGSVDIVLSDVALPKLPGTALADIARRRWPDVKVLLMSGNAPAGLAALYPLISKPFRRAELARTMAALLAETTDQDCGV